MLTSDDREDENREEVQAQLGNSRPLFCKSFYIFYCYGLLCTILTITQ